MNTSFSFAPTTPAPAVIAQIRTALEQAGYSVAEVDDTRPWGGFIRLANTDAVRFRQEFFPGVPSEHLSQGLSASPKILVIMPGKQLSDQSHSYRAEDWFVVHGPVGVKLGDASGNLPDTPTQFTEGQNIAIAVTQRHRLVGLPNTIGIVAETWNHVNPSHPSDEADIIRYADDYGRTS